MGLGADREVDYAMLRAVNCHRRILASKKGKRGALSRNNAVHTPNNCR